MTEEINKINYHTFFELSDDLMCVANLDGYFEEVNQSFLNVLGYSKEILLEKPLLDFIHPMDILKTQQAVSDQGEGKSITSFENRYKHKDGHYLTLQWTSKLDKKINKIFATARDVTEHSNNLNRLIQIEAGLNKEVIVSEADVDGKIISVNNKFCEISGYNESELIGENHRIINSEYHEKSFFEDMWSCISSGDIWSGAIRNKRKNGEFYFVQTVITPILDHEGEIKSYLSFRQDITESINSETEISRIMKVLNETN